MLKINLLPWRETLRKQQQQNFVLALGAGVLLSCLLLLVAYWRIAALQEYQQQRNILLSNALQEADKTISKVNAIKQQKQTLLAKIEAIQAVQESRSQSAHLLVELSNTIPDGIFLTQFKQKGNALSFSGKAHATAKVSAYMQAIEASPWLSSPKLQVIQAEARGAGSDFMLHARLDSGSEAKKTDQQQ